jgi:hypothetical protein
VLVAAIVWIANSTVERNDAGEIVDGGLLTYEDVREGDCLDIDGLEDGATISGFDFRGVPCDESHNAEVAGIVQISGESYPGESEVSEQARAGCVSFQSELPEGLDLFPLYPTEDLWDDFDTRKALCLAVRTDYSDMTGQQLR